MASRYTPNMPTDDPVAQSSSPGLVMGSPYQSMSSISKSMGADLQSIFENIGRDVSMSLQKNLTPMFKELGNELIIAGRRAGEEIGKSYAQKLDDQMKKIGETSKLMADNYAGLMKKMLDQSKGNPNDPYTRGQAAMYETALQNFSTSSVGGQTVFDIPNKLGFARHVTQDQLNPADVVGGLRNQQNLSKWSGANAVMDQTQRLAMMGMSILTPKFETMGTTTPTMEQEMSVQHGMAGGVLQTAGAIGGMIPGPVGWGIAGAAAAGSLVNSIVGSWREADLKRKREEAEWGRVGAGAGIGFESGKTAYSGIVRGLQHQYGSEFKTEELKQLTVEIAKMGTVSKSVSRDVALGAMAMKAYGLSVQEFLQTKETYGRMGMEGQMYGMMAYAQASTKNAPSFTTAERIETAADLAKTTATWGATTSFATGSVQRNALVDMFATAFANSGSTVTSEQVSTMVNALFSSSSTLAMIGGVDYDKLMDPSKLTAEDIGTLLDNIRNMVFTNPDQAKYIINSLPIDDQTKLDLYTLFGSAEKPGGWIGKKEDIVNHLNQSYKDQTKIGKATAKLPASAVSTLTSATPGAGEMISQLNIFKTSDPKMYGQIMKMAGLSETGVPGEYSMSLTDEKTLRRVLNGGGTEEQQAYVAQLMRMSDEDLENLPAEAKAVNEMLKKILGPMYNVRKAQSQGKSPEEMTTSPTWGNTKPLSEGAVKLLKQWDTGSANYKGTTPGLSGGGSSAALNINGQKIIFELQGTAAQIMAMLVNKGNAANAFNSGGSVNPSVNYYETGD